MVKAARKAVKLLEELGEKRWAHERRSLLATSEPVSLLSRVHYTVKTHKPPWQSGGAHDTLKSGRNHERTGHHGAQMDCGAHGE